MGIIKLLPDNLVNQIAAGEVIERPASVVKELIENSLDSGADRVRVELEAGGRDGIVVEDNGGGMDADDILLALERHATSKIANMADLLSIRTLGFRGEALSSIASVSRLSISSRPRSQDAGNCAHVTGGKYVGVTPCGMAAGTRVEVGSLFYNLPARRKFLKSPPTELSHVITALEHYALANPGVAFSLFDGGKEILNLHPSGGYTQRFFTLFESFCEGDFMPVSLSEPHVSVEGLAGLPEKCFSGARYQFTLVNGRFVRDRLLQHAISEGYYSTHPQGRYPALFLRLSLPPERLDVNVHPAKREVRFRDSQAVHDSLVKAVGGAVNPRVPRPPAGELQSAVLAADGLQAGGGAIRETPALFYSEPRPATDLGVAPPRVDGPNPSPYRVIGQWRSSFIICDGPEGLTLVDQHAAHERVRYEELKGFIKRSGARKQFLIPRLYPLPLEMRHRAEEVAQILTGQGFDSEPFGDGTVAVRSAPAFLGETECDAFLREFSMGVSDVLKLPRESWNEVLMMRSCRGAIMLGEPLSNDKLQLTVDRLISMGAPLTCPHGRPILFSITEREIRSKFLR